MHHSRLSSGSTYFRHRRQRIPPLGIRRLGCKVMTANVHKDHHRGRRGCPNINMSMSTIATRNKMPNVQKMSCEVGAGGICHSAQWLPSRLLSSPATSNVAPHCAKTAAIIAVYLHWCRGEWVLGYVCTLSSSIWICRSSGVECWVVRMN